MRRTAMAGALLVVLIAWHALGVSAQLPVFNYTPAVVGTDWRTGQSAMPTYNLTFSNNSITLFDVPVLVPDEMNGYSDLTVLGDIGMQIVTSLAGYVNAIASAELDVDFIPFVFGLLNLQISAAIADALAVAGQFVGVGHMSAGFISFAMFPPPLVPDSTQHVTQLLESAPNPCDKACQSELFPAVGTHYTAGGTIGVTVDVFVSVNATWVQANGQAMAEQGTLLVVKFAGWLLGIATGYNESSSWNNLPAQFEANADIRVFFNGQRLDDWRHKTPAWIEDQVLHHPELARRRLRPITDLCTSAAQRANLNAALQQYLYGTTPDAHPPANTAVGTLASRVGRVAADDKREPKRAKCDEERVCAVGRLGSPEDCGLLPWNLHPPLPGAEWLAGFDSPTASPTLPIAVWTYTEPVSCYRLPSNPLKIYRVPDQLSVMAAPMACNCMGYNMMSNVSDWISVRYSDITKRSGLFGMDVDSTQTLNAAGQFIAHRQFAMWNASCDTYYRIVTQLTPFDIHPTLTAVVNALPETWSPDNSTVQWQVYNEFTEMYGPYYIHAASVGGSAIVKAMFDSCFFAEGGADFVAEESFNTFLGLFNDLSGSAGGHAGLAAYWDAYAQVSTQLTGNFIRFKFQNLNAWQQDLAMGNNLGVVSFELSPLSSLIFWDDVRAKNIALAAEDYLTRAVAQSEQYQSQLKPPTPPTPPPWCTGATAVT